MIRKLLATTALTAVLASGAAYAQTTPAQPAQPAQDNQTQQTMPAENANSPIFNRDAESIANDTGYFEADASLILASSLLGMTVYNGTGEDAEAVGDINDVVMAENGTAEAVIIGVGGFLGLGEKEVAVDFDRLTWTADEDGERRLIIDSTKEELEAAPEFDRDVLEGDADADMAATNANMQPADQTAEKTDEKMEQPAADANNTAQQNAATTTEPANKDAAATNNTTAAGDMKATQSMEVVDVTSISAEELIGARVRGAEDEDIGEIGDVILSDTQSIEAYLVDVGGFIGMGEKTVAVDGSTLDIVKDENGGLIVRTSFTKEQLEAQPEYTEDAYAQDRDAVVLK